MLEVNTKMSKLLFLVIFGFSTLVQSQYTSPGNTGSNPCASHSCPQNFRCVIQQVQCFNPPCNTITTCQPFAQPRPTPRPRPRPGPSCSNTSCRRGSRCILSPVQCFRGPCYPIPRCVRY